MSAMTDEQRKAYARWDRNRRTLKAQGLWQPFVSARPVRERVWAMNAAGMPTNAIEARLGMPAGTLHHTMWKRELVGEYSKEIRRETAEAVMAYWPTLEDFPDHCLIEAVGSRRRVEALITLGWTQVYLAGKVGMSEKALRRALKNPKVTAATARRLVVLYDELWKRRPYITEIPAVLAERTRRQAQAAGFVGPLAWDDDTIDDPAAVAQTDAAMPASSEGPNLADRWLHGEAVILGVEDRKQVLRHLFEWSSETPAEIAYRLDMTPDTASRTWERIKERARKEGQRPPWRRTYVPGERTLTKNQMEAAA